ncbi:hypothetical protein G7Y89_g770 [Cudoniella acicularis]|uniref:Uncharacterized protein n=1 Tax=Cudoniella acicularis TaxID=354080 RepID=A0A8H4RYI5_9HELO|nr:hypothetical protein G7Y89_g770 [Cudoniella acicularis]
METPKLAKPTGTVLGLLLIIAFQTTSDEHRVLPKLSSLSLHPSRISNLEDEHQGILHRRDSSVELPKSSSSISDDEDNSDLLAGGTTALRGQRQGSLTYLNGLSLVVGLQIGSGIFSAPSEVSKHVPNAPAAIAVWLVAGLLVWTGALAFIELGRAIPKNGGIQEYIRQCYGDIYAFLFSWVWIAIVKPCSIAVISTIFAEHLNSAVLPNSWTSVWVNKLVALIGITLITMVNCLGTNTGANAANGFLVLKLFGLFSIVAIGIFIGVSGKALSETQPTKPVTPETAFNTTPNAKLPGLWVTLGEYVTAFFGALFCYGGWETVGFVAGDMRDPQRDLSRVINSAMAIVLFGFVFMNLSLYIVLPMDTIRDQKTVAVTFGYYVFGTPGTLIYSFVVSMSCLGALNSNVFATGRLYAMVLNGTIASFYVDSLSADAARCLPPLTEPHLDKFFHKSSSPSTSKSTSTFADVGQNCNLNVDMTSRLSTRGFRATMFTRRSLLGSFGPSNFASNRSVGRSPYSQIAEIQPISLPVVRNIRGKGKGYYEMYTKSHIPGLFKRHGVFHLDPKLYLAAAHVFPMRNNNYVCDELIDWSNVPDDPMFQLTFPQPEMLNNENLRKMLLAMADPAANKCSLVSAAEDIRRGLNPHPAGQKRLNVPILDGVPIEGMQHKYKETVLFFPSEGQFCHAYCSYCFRWAQFTSVGSDQQFKSSDAEGLHDYIAYHKFVKDLLFTGGDPMVMQAKTLNRYITPLLESEETNHLQTIRIGTKSLAYWPYRFTTDDDAKDMLNLFEKIVKSGKHLSVQAHFTHPRELSTSVVKEAMKLIQMTGATIRCQSPLIRHVNDSGSVWSTMWNEQTKLGAIPYYMFVERDTGAHEYFSVPLARALEVFNEAYSNLAGTARTVRGPSMSADPGKIGVVAVSEIAGEKVFVLKFLQARKPKWVNEVFYAKYDPNATWLDDLKPAFGEKEWFYEQEFKNSEKHLDIGSSGQTWTL